MKTIIHLSDLHFGTEKKYLLNPLLTDIKSQSPDIILISGDLTQRATNVQFKAAKNFIQSLKPYNVLCVPGNHDIPLYNLLARFLYPYRQYQKFISSDLCIKYYDDQLAILGVNSVTPYKRLSGFISKKQLTSIESFFTQHPDKFKIVIMHHNLVKSVRHKILNRSEEIINQFAHCHVNLVLSGHIHADHVELLKRDYLAHNMYVITAGTPISTRTIEPNSYNLIKLNQNEFTLTVRTAHENHFRQTKEKILKF